MTSETQQDPGAMAQPTDEHRWLQRLVGEWTFEAEMSSGPDQPPEKSTGTETVRRFGDLWVVAEMSGMGDESHTSIMTLGFDPEKGRFTGTFISSMGTMLWLYDGSLDSGRRVLTLDSEGPGMAGDGKTAKYQDIIELIDDDHRVFRSRAQDPDGKWQEFMVMNYRRAK